MEHLRYLKSVNNIFAVIDAVIGVVAVIGLIGMIVSTSGADQVFTSIMIGMTVFVAIMSVLSVILLVATGKKVEQGRWRVMQTVLAVLNVMNNPPLGTAYGIYALWVCWMNPDSKRCFDQGSAAPAGGAEDPKAAKTFKIVRLIMVISGVLLVLLAAGTFVGVSYMLSWGSQETEVVVTADQVEIRGMYGEVIQRSQLRTVELRDQLPTITLRTNGYALGGTLKGWFATTELGEVKLFVQNMTAPYLYLQGPQHWVIISFSDPERTRALHQQLTSGGAPAAPGP